MKSISNRNGNKQNLNSDLREIRSVWNGFKFNQITRDVSLNQIDFW